jgi:hypothetical protein
MLEEDEQKSLFSEEIKSKQVWWFFQPLCFGGFSDLGFTSGGVICYG